MSGPTNTQGAVTREVVAWYLRHHHGAVDNPGFPGMYCEPGQVGHLAVSRLGLAAGSPQDLYGALLVTVMFQTMRDEFVRRRLRTFSPEEAAELVDRSALISSAAQLACKCASSTDLLREECDLRLDGDGSATCMRAPGLLCQMKRHTRLLRRYGHFGKVPTSLALMVRESGALDLPDLYREATKQGSPREDSTQSGED